MKQVLIRNLDEELVASLKTQAKQNNRSLEGEIRAILEERRRVRSMSEIKEELRRFRASFGKKKYSDSAKLIRADRER